MDIADLLSALAMGVLEGLTEFLPISSTGHLILLGELIGFEGPPGKVFEISIQLGAICAVIWAFWRSTCPFACATAICACARVCSFTWSVCTI